MDSNINIAAEMSEEKIDLTAKDIRQRFEAQYAESLKQATDQELALAFDILTRYKNNYPLTTNDKLIIEQMKLLSSVGTIRQIVTSEMLSRKPANRDTRRKAQAIKNRIERVKQRQENYDLYCEAVRGKTTIDQVLADRSAAAAKELVAGLAS